MARSRSPRPSPTSTATCEYSKLGQCELFGAYVGDPIHRFYQMWQQTAAFHGRLNTWVANTAGDDNGAIPPAPIYQGSVQMGFYNMAQGDAPILRNLAQNYAISDNYHQAVQGGTGANHIALGTGFAASYQDASGNAAAPPKGEIENPNPKPGTNNNYTQDGYGSSTTPNTGGSYSECADLSQPGVGPVFSYLNTLPYQVLHNCQPGPVLPAEQLQPRLQGQRHPGDRALHRAAAEDRLRDDRQLALRARHQLGLLRRGLQQREPHAGLLRDLRPDAVLRVDHDQPHAACLHPARRQPVHRRRDQGHPARGVLPQARRRRRSPRLFHARRRSRTSPPGPSPRSRTTRSYGGTRPSS